MPRPCTRDREAGNQLKVERRKKIINEIYLLVGHLCASPNQLKSLAYRGAKEIPLNNLVLSSYDS
jgi:hypothetical protein